MRKTSRGIFSLLFAISLLVLFQAAPKAFAGEQPNLLIVGEDADLDTVPRNSRVFNRVLNAISGEMQLKGFRVYDETAVTMGITNPGRVRRTDAELITVARRVQDVPIDAIVAFQIYASAEQNQYADIIDLRIRVFGRIIHVQTGRSMGNFEVAYGPNDVPPLPAGCNPDCVLEHVGGEAKRIATDVGAVLAIKLDQLSPTAPRTGLETVPSSNNSGTAVITTMPSDSCTGLTTAYNIDFRGFSPEEISRVEEYLVAFKGYDHHRPIRSQMTSTIYWYETCSDLARLNRNLRLMTEQMGVQARISMSGNRFEIDKIGVPINRN